MRPAETADLDDDGFPRDADGSGPDARRNWLDRPWMWPLFGLIGMVVFELTTNPGLAVAVFCVKLGVSDVRLGLWLARTDPNRQRGTITGLMAASLIGLKITLASLIIAILLVVLAHTFDRNAGQNQAVIGQCARSLGITAAVAMCVSLLIARWGFRLARRAGQKVWLESNMHRAPTDNIWPLECVGSTSRNMVIDVAQFCFLLQIPLIMWGAVSASFLIMRVFPDFMPWGIGIGFILEILSYAHLRITIGAVAAKHPGECWPELMATRHFRSYDEYRLEATRRKLEVIDEEAEYDESAWLPEK